MAEKKAITLYQPHATLMVIGEKRIETRSRKWDYTGPLVIHAGLFKGWLKMCEIEPFKSALASHGYSASNLAFGAYIGEVFMQGCDTVEVLRPRLSWKEYSFGNYSDGRYAYSCSCAEHYTEPIPAKGKQGVWDV